MSYTILKLTDSLFYSKETDLVLKVSDGIYISLLYDVTKQISGVFIQESIYANIDSFKIEDIVIVEKIEALVNLSRNETILANESLSFHAYKNNDDHVTILENVFIVLISGSNIINGSSVNGAII